MGLLRFVIPWPSREAGKGLVPSRAQAEGQEQRGQQQQQQHHLGPLRPAQRLLSPAFIPRRVGQEAEHKTGAPAALWDLSSTEKVAWRQREMKPLGPNNSPF